MIKPITRHPLSALIRASLISAIPWLAIMMAGGCSGGDCWVEIREFRWGDTIGPIWGLSPRDIYVLGVDAGTYHFDGDEWTKLPNSIGGYDIWGTSNEDLFFAHSEGVLHFNGETGTEMMEGALAFSSIWGSSNADIFAATKWDTRIFHYDGNSWEEMATPKSDVKYQFLEAIWGTSGSDVYTVGWEENGHSSGKVLYYDGTTWEEILKPNGMSSFSDVWGANENDVFIVGNYGDIYHFDGSQWLKMETGMWAQFHAIWGTSGENVFAVGANYVLHYDGVKWTNIGPSSEYALSGVWASSDTDVYVVGCKLVNDGNDLLCGKGVVLKYNCSLEEPQ